MKNIELLSSSTFGRLLSAEQLPEVETCSLMIKALGIAWTELYAQSTARKMLGFSGNNKARMTEKDIDELDENDSADPITNAKYRSIVIAKLEKYLINLQSDRKMYGVNLGVLVSSGAMLSLIDELNFDQECKDRIKKFYSDYLDLIESARQDVIKLLDFIPEVTRTKAYTDKTYFLSTYDKNYRAYFDDFTRYCTKAGTGIEEFNNRWNDIKTAIANYRKVYSKLATPDIGVIISIFEGTPYQFKETKWKEHPQAEKALMQVLSTHDLRKIKL